MFKPVNILYIYFILKKIIISFNEKKKKFINNNDIKWKIKKEAQQFKI